MDLPDQLTLPLSAGEEYWYWLGGRPALDFVNTLRERWRRQVETLVTPRDLVSWLHRAGLPVGRHGRADAELLGQARELREAIDGCVTAILGSRRVARPRVEVIDRWLPEAAVAHQLQAAPLGVPVLRPRAPSQPIRHALGLLALDAAEMLGTDQRSRVRVCASETCSARFYDHSPRATRRWCSMSGCGNTAKVRRHRATHRR